MDLTKQGSCPNHRQFTEAIVETVQNKVGALFCQIHVKTTQ